MSQHIYNLFLLQSKKAVRFNMDKNETCVIIQPELNGDTDDDDDEDADNNNNNNAKKVMMRNVRFADDLELSDDEEVEQSDQNDDGKKEVQKLQHGFHGDDDQVIYRFEMLDVTGEFSKRKKWHGFHFRGKVFSENLTTF